MGTIVRKKGKGSPEPCGFIYEIRNKINDKVYIGKTTKKNPIDRKHQHFHLLKKEKHHNKHLQHSFNKYGQQNFQFKVIVFVYSSDRLNLLEQEFIWRNKSTDSGHGYNLTEGGDGGNLSEYSETKISYSLRMRHYFLRRQDHYNRFYEGRFNLNSKEYGNYVSSRHVKIKLKIKLNPVKGPKQNRLRIPQYKYNRFREILELKKVLYSIYKKREGYPHSPRTEFFDMRGPHFD